MEQQIIAFCIPGKHDGPVVGSTSEGATVATGWRLVRASVVDGKWYYDPDSPAKISCCNLHLPEGTPECDC